MEDRVAALEARVDALILLVDRLIKEFRAHYHPGVTAGAANTSVVATVGTADTGATISIPRPQI